MLTPSLAWDLAPDPVLIGLGLLVGLLVGLTGIGGGSLLTPLLVLVAGVRPTVAVGTDLAFAALTKLVGTCHLLPRRAVDLGLTLRLALGSLPGALLGAYLIDVLQAAAPGAVDEVIRRALGVVLCLAGLASLVRALEWSRIFARGPQPGPLATSLLGLGLGFLVGLTSIGAGALLMAVFALRYRLSAVRAVGTDIAHGAILATVAALAHGAAGRVEPALLLNLLVGSIPGVLLGSWLTGRLPGRPVRIGIAIVLAVSGLRLL